MCTVYNTTVKKTSEPRPSCWATHLQHARLGRGVVHEGEGAEGEAGQRAGALGNGRAGGVGWGEAGRSEWVGLGLGGGGVGLGVGGERSN